MNEPMKKYFKVGLIHFMAYPSTIKGDGPIIETVSKILVDEYFDAIEITHIKDDFVRAQVKDLLDQSHMTVCYGAQPVLLTNGLNPNSINEAQRQRAENALIASIDEAEYLGSRGIAFLSGKWEEATKDQSYAQLIKTTSNLCEYAAKKDMNVELEVFDYDVDKASLIGPAPLAAKFAADISSKYNNFGLLVDLSHFPLTYETSEFVIKSLKQYITHLHIGNAVVTPGAQAYGDAHPRFGFPNGAIDTEQVLDFLRVCKHEGFFNESDPITLSFEVKPWDGENSDIVVANAKRVLDRAWALL